jgi:hypothetical protein
MGLGGHRPKEARGMTETLIFFAGASLLAISILTLFVAVKTLETARRYVDLAEERLEALREGQDQLLARLEERRLASEKEREADVRTPEAAGRSIERTKRELLGLRSGQRSRGVTREGQASGPSEETPGARQRPDDATAEKPQKIERAGPPAGLPETRSSGAGEPANEGEPSRRAVKRPHPDDDVEPGSTLAGQVRAAGGSPVQMFRVFYDRYLDNYEGYVKLAERIHKARTDEERVPGSRAEHDWKGRLRRANEGIERTAQRLDILEHSNPELASDDRVSRRAAIARIRARMEE